MKIAKYLLAFWVVFLMLPSCGSAEKAAHERRNLMMPERTDLKRNSKFKSTKKTNNPSRQKKNKR